MDFCCVFSLRNLLLFSDSLCSHPELWQVFISTFSNLVSFNIFYFTHLDLFWYIVCEAVLFFLCLQIAIFFNRFRWTESCYKFGPKRRWWVGGGWKDLVMRAEPSGDKTKAETRGDSGPAFLNLDRVPGTVRGNFEVVIPHDLHSHSEILLLFVLYRLV